MKQFIDKLIERLEEIEVENSCYGCTYRTQCDAVQEKVSDETDLCGATIKEVAIEIVNQLAEEHKDDIQTIDVSELLGEPEQVKQSNADRLRSMSDEELAEHFSELIRDTRRNEYLTGVGDWLLWLQSEAE